MRAQRLGLRPGDRELLASWTRASTVRAGLAQRARIVLLAADGVSNTEIAERVGVARQTVISWRTRYVQSGVKGLGDERRSGRPRTVDRARILAATLAPPPKKLGITHWSSRLLASHLKTDASTVLRTWRHYRVQPWRSETFKFSTDPQLVAKVTDVVGLYLAPPENAIVLSVDEKSQIQALDRTQKMLPMQPGFPERRTHDYVRHGTSTLFAALEVATGKVTAACKPRHRHQEFLAFLKQVARAYPADVDEQGQPIELGAFGLRGVVDLVLATVTALPAAVAALAVYGVGTSVGNVSFTSLLQSHVPDALRGRVLTAYDLIWHSMRLASLVLGGVLTDLFGIRFLFYAGGVLLLVAALAGLGAGPRSRAPGVIGPG